MQSGSLGVILRLGLVLVGCHLSSCVSSLPQVHHGGCAALQNAPATPPVARVPQQPNGHVVIVAHGLNLKPEKMQPMGEVLFNRGYTVVYSRFSGHMGEENPSWKAETWLQNAQEAYCLAESLRGHKGHLYLVGFSLGALVHTTHYAVSPEVQYRSLTLFAPPFSVHWYTKSVKLLFWFPWLPIPSANHREYRANSWLPVRAYQALFNLMYTLVSQPGRKKLLESSGTVVYHPDDELVSASGTLEWIEGNLPRWETVRLETEVTELKPKYHHLMVDEMSLGEAQWQRVQQTLLKLNKRVQDDM